MSDAPEPMILHGRNPRLAKAVLGVILILVGAVGSYGGFLILTATTPISGFKTAFAFAGLAMLMAGVVFLWQGWTGRHGDQVVAKIDTQGLVIRPHGVLPWVEVQSFAVVQHKSNDFIRVKARRRTDLSRSFLIAQPDRVPEVIDRIIAFANANDIAVEKARGDHWTLIPQDPEAIPRETRPGFIHR